MIDLTSHAQLASSPHHRLTITSRILIVTGLLAVISITGRLLFADSYRPLNALDSVIAAARPAEGSATPTATATLPANAIIWANDMVSLPTVQADIYCVTPTPSLNTSDPNGNILCNTQYGYLPPNWVVYAIHTDFDLMINNYHFASDAQSAKVASRYLYIDSSSTLTPIPDPKTIDKGQLGWDMSTYTLVGCTADGSVCKIHDLIQHAYQYNLVPGTTKQVRTGNYPDLMMTFIMKWDKHDGHWKRFTLNTQVAQYSTATPAS